MENRKNQGFGIKRSSGSKMVKHRVKWPLVSAFDISGTIYRFSNISRKLWYTYYMVLNRETVFY